MRTDLMDSGESEFAYEDFVKAPKCHWMEEARTLGSDVESPSFRGIQLGEDESNFMISAKGPYSLHAVFEDAAEPAFLGVNREIEMRKPTANSQADGFCASEWPEGFAHLLKSTDEK